MNNFPQTWRQSKQTIQETLEKICETVHTSILPADTTFPTGFSWKVFRQNVLCLSAIVFEPRFIWERSTLGREMWRLISVLWTCIRRVRPLSLSLSELSSVKHYLMVRLEVFHEWNISTSGHHRRNDLHTLNEMWIICKSSNDRFIALEVQWSN